MRFRIRESELVKWLEIVNHATASITTTPILENILIKVNFDNIVLTSNNLETAIEYTLRDDLEIFSEGSFCVPSKLFTNYINLVLDDEIEIELLKDSLEIRSDSWTFKIKWIPSEEFPLIPTIKEEVSLNIKWNILTESIRKTLFSAAEWNIRPTLAWILVNIKKDEAVFASTDSFRLSEYKAQLLTDNVASFNGIIPSKTAQEIKSIIKSDIDVKIVSGNLWLAFFFWNTKFYSRLLNGKFPDYTSFFPKKHSTKAEINKVDLIQALKKINLVSRENNYSIKMSFSSEFWIVLETNETQIWEWETRLVWAVDWEDNIIWINSVYFLEVLWVIDTTHVSISFESALAPILITPLADPDKKKDDSSFTHIIMPLKI
jgi:DNA polymerase-3 subunit beta